MLPGDLFGDRPTGRLPRIAELDAGANGWGFFLCMRKEVRVGRNGGEFITVVLQDVSGEIGGKVFEDVDGLKGQFEAGEFVKVRGRGSVYNQRLELVLDNIRRVEPVRDRLDGFREEDCVRSAPRPADEMWAELEGHVARVGDPHVRALLERALADTRERFRVWPAAVTVHHAYRSGLVEHVLKIIEVASGVADAYGARRDLLVAGAILHDIGKLEELRYDAAAEYSLEGNLVGHIALGVARVGKWIDEMPGFPVRLRREIEHLILSHHGSRELGSPVEPMSVEAFILAAVDDLDAKLHQVVHHTAVDESPGAFTAYHPRLRRVLLKPDDR